MYKMHMLYIEIYVHMQKRTCRIYAQIQKRTCLYVYIHMYEYARVYISILPHGFSGHINRITNRFAYVHVYEVYIYSKVDQFVSTKRYICACVQMYEIYPQKRDIFAKEICKRDLQKMRANKH